MYFLYKSNYPELIDKEIFRCIKSNCIDQCLINKIKLRYNCHYQKSVLNLKLKDEISDIDRYFSFLTISISILSAVYTILATIVVKEAFGKILAVLGLLLTYFLLNMYYKKVNLHYRYFKIIMEIMHENID
ncbi:hypothetical protein CLOACE_14880 [Clostridium acetireducens DSM 10703]|jgi:hypothetical protein|uniref:Uncharacterized protein n=1 Tax=Clostridium acetireducens DSM 10703 TaxID=1121290 RepID=A0A1E8EYF9_9CLOT|nr:hypothetical protein [Clostridium acetireducens]OFI05870.1 hypothetical protein CLOACE_14880 [Clostridium acetireducens DSM 10703]